MIPISAWMTPSRWPMRDDPFAAAGIQKLCLAVDSERVKAHFLAALRG
ncbi:hypothetical protein [Erwinia sp. S38]|nr:hypothetical protein [Erwinia sp. S38]MBK0004589.1 hypothetical protein [Erwinia sp. S38]